MSTIADLGFHMEACTKQELKNTIQICKKESKSFIGNAKENVFIGESDGIVLRDDVLSLYDKEEGVKLVVVERAGHLPHLEQPEQVCETFIKLF